MTRYIFFTADRFTSNAKGRPGMFGVLVCPALNGADKSCEDVGGVARYVKKGWGMWGTLGDQPQSVKCGVCQI